MIIKSSQFIDGDPIPQNYTCEGQDVPPPLAWDFVPKDAEALALIVDDPDAPDPEAPTRTYVHWVLYDIPPETTGLDGKGRELPRGTREGLNDWNRTGYGGPCPPKGRHRYFFKLYALDTQLGDLGRPTKSQLLEAMQGHILEEARMVGTYEKAKRSS